MSKASEPSKNGKSDTRDEPVAVKLTGSSVNSAGKNDSAPNELTPEEQMALYEKDLKENDWGHQPC